MYGNPARPNELLREEKGWLTDVGHNLWWMTHEMCSTCSKYPQIRKDGTIQTSLVVALKNIKGPIHMVEGGHHLTHWGRVTHIWVVKLTIIGSDNGLSPGRRQTIIWINAGILLIRLLGTNFSEIFIGIQTFSLKKMHLKIWFAKWCPFVSASMC